MGPGNRDGAVETSRVFRVNSRKNPGLTGDYETQEIQEFLKLVESPDLLLL
jgi:hypothetical protein